jgi:hypothetical protein
MSDVQRELAGVRAHTLSSYADRWEQRKAKQGRRNVRRERRALGRHIDPALGRRKLTDIAPADLLDLFWSLYDNGLSAKTVRNLRGSLSSMFALAVLERIVDLLLRDERIPLDRRVLYALHFYLVAREGEACGVNFDRWDHSQKPFHAMTIDQQYDAQSPWSPMSRRSVSRPERAPRFHSAFARRAEEVDPRNHSRSTLRNARAQASNPSSSASFQGQCQVQGQRRCQRQSQRQCPCQRLLNILSDRVAWTLFGRLYDVARHDALADRRLGEIQWQRSRDS